MVITQCYMVRRLRSMRVLVEPLTPATGCITNGTASCRHHQHTEDCLTLCHVVGLMFGKRDEASSKDGELPNAAGGL